MKNQISKLLARLPNGLARFFFLGFSFAIINVSFMNCSPKGFEALQSVNPGDASGAGNTGGSGGTTGVTAGTTGEVPVPAAKRFQFACTPAAVQTSKMQRLSRRELQNTLKDLLTQVNAALYDATLQTEIAALPSDQVDAKINNQTVGETEDTTLVYSTHISNYFKVAFDIGAKISSTTANIQKIPGTAGCLAMTITDACITNFVNGFGLQAFRRPLTATEVTQYKAYFNSSDFGTTAQKIQAVVAIFLQSPDFLYRIYDQGAVSTTNVKTRILTDYEFASKLSYLITGTMPDVTLMAKAGNGSLKTAAGVTTEVSRLLALPAARPAIARFFKEWLQYDMLPDMTTFPSTVINGVDTTNLAANMMNEIDSTILSTVFDRNGTYKDLMTTRNSVITGANLSQIYGINNPNGAVVLDNSRAGILSRAGFLAKQSQPKTAPVKRGRFILNNILCRTIGNPPPNAPAQLPTIAPDQFLTTRDRYEQLTVRDANGVGVVNCMGCHSRMNPLGYTYEAFDPFGRIRLTEPVTNTSGGQSVTKDLPINTASISNELDVLNVPLNSYLDLHSYLSNSDVAMSCMSQQWFTFLEKRAPAADSADGCFMNETLNTSYGAAGVQGSIQDIIKKTILSSSFRNWNN